LNQGHTIWEIIKEVYVIPATLNNVTQGELQRYENNYKSLNLITTAIGMKTFIEMDLNLKDLILVHNTFHRVIPGQSSTPIRRIDLEISCETGDNKCKEVLTFEVASFNIGYNSILGRPFLLKFVAVIHTAYATIKMSSPKGVITLKADQHDALACENATLMHVG
jgi:hypothetical protein